MTTASVPAEQHAPRPPSGDGDTVDRAERDEGGGSGPSSPSGPAPDAPPRTGTTAPARPPGEGTGEPVREAGPTGESGGTDPVTDGVAHADSAAPAAPGHPAVPPGPGHASDGLADDRPANGRPATGRSANALGPDNPEDADTSGHTADATARNARSAEGTDHADHAGDTAHATSPAPAAPDPRPHGTHRASCPACHRPLTDPLTGALDRFSWEAAAAPAIEAARRDGAPVALVLADLDGFKGVNDRYGHPAGDAVLSVTGGVLRALAAEVDGALVGRYGSWAGDEFLILLPGARVADAVALAHRAAREVRAARVEAPAGRQATVTLSGQRVSLGVAGVRRVPHSGPEVPDVLRALVLDADAALRAAKRAGGGRVHVQADPPDDPAAAPPAPRAAPDGGGGTAGPGPLDSVRIALPPDEVRLHGAGPAELVLTPAAAEHLHAVLSELLTRPHSREDR